MSRSRLQKSELKRELWRIEDVLAGLSASKANFNITVDSIQNPGEFPPAGGGALVLEVGCVRLTVSPSNREEICAFDVRSDCAFSEGGGPASASLLPLPRRADIGEFLRSSSSSRFRSEAIHCKRSSVRGRSPAQAAAASLL